MLNNITGKTVTDAFHADTPAACIAGLRLKVRRATARATGSIVNVALGRRLGFCSEGMTSFARAMDLDIHGEYTAAEIESAVRNNLAAARPYASELRRLAAAVGHPIADDLR